MSLYDFLVNPNNYVARERLLYIKASYDMKLHAATSQEQIQMTEPEIDNNGYDFTVSLRHFHIYIQNKSTLSDVGVNQWKIHPTLLQPSFCDRDLAPKIDEVQVWGCGEGASGGVLLHKIDADAARRNELRVDYFYFDIWYAGAVNLGLWQCNGFDSSEAKELLKQINNGQIGDRISLPLRAFLSVRSPAAVLGLRFGLPQESNYISILDDAESGEDVSVSKLLWENAVRPWM